MQIWHYFRHGVYGSLAAAIMVFIAKELHQKDFTTSKVLLLIILVAFLLIDYLSRTLSRNRILEDYIEEDRKYLLLDTLAMLTELVGLVFYLAFAFIVYESRNVNIKSGFYFGWFCVFTSFHNSLMVVFAKELKFWTFNKDVFKNDFSEYDDTYNRWGGVFVRCKNKTINRVVKQFKHLRKTFQEFVPLESKLPISLFNKTLINYFSSASIIGTLHALVQLLGFHLIFLNLIVGVRLMAQYDTNLPLISPYVSIPFIVILICVLACYWLVSRQEMRRRYHHLDKNQIEDKWQFRGNVFLFLLSLFIILVPRTELTIKYFFIEQIFVGLSFLLHGKTTTI